MTADRLTRTHLASSPSAGSCPLDAPRQGSQHLEPGQCMERSQQVLEQIQLALSRPLKPPLVHRQATLGPANDPSVV